MNVRISYTTDIDDVPSKIADRLQIPDKKLNNNSRKIDLIIDILLESDGKYAKVALEMIDELRKELSNVDQDLMECCSILEGYIQVQSSPPPVVLADMDKTAEIDATLAEMAQASGELSNLENNDV